MSEEVWLAVDGRLMRARPIVVYELLAEKEEWPTPPTPLPPAAMKKRDTSRFGVRYSAEQKASILAEANQPGVYAKDVARKYGVNPSSITYWRQQSLKVKGKRLARKAS